MNFTVFYSAPNIKVVKLRRLIDGICNTHEENETCLKMLVRKSEWKRPECC